MKNHDNPLYQDPEYVQGQIYSLQALILGLAQLSSSREFRDNSIERLDALKNALLSQPVSEARLIAIDDCKSWVLMATE